MSLEKTFSVGDSKFQIPSGWEVHSGPATQLNSKSVDIWMGNDPRMQIELLEQQSYESDYNEASQDTTGNYEITTEEKSINGINVKIVRSTDKRNGDIFDDFFFQKNGKYYHITAWDYTTQAAARGDIDSAVDTIVTTIQ